MARSLSKLLSIAPGEEQKTSLLYILHLLFYLGLMWGEAAKDSLYLSAWSADDLAYIFIALAAVGFIMGIAYAFIASRFSTGLLLKIIVGSMVVWLVSVQVMLETNGGKHGAVYPYFYLVYSAFRDISTMHILVYINEFYDTRASKRALPLLLSAGIAGSALAGFSAKLLNKWIGLKNTPLAWAVCLVICFVIILIIERRLSGDLEQIERQHKKAAATHDEKKSNGLQNLREGFKFVNQSGLLRWLAAGTFVMVVLTTLLTYHANHEFATLFPKTDDLNAYLNLVNGISSVSGLLVQSLFLSNLINWLGVGTMNLVYPIITVGAISAINFVPGVASATFSRLDTSAIKQTFRNPLDAMLYNSVPINSKARARGFMGGVIVPLGTLAAGLIVLAIKWKIFKEPLVIAIGVGAALLYVLVMLNVRREYGRSMTSLLAGDEIAIFRQDQSEVLPPDPSTVIWLSQKLQSLPTDSSADGQAVFISQILYDMDSRSALPIIFEMADRRGSFFRKGIIELLDQSNLDQPDFMNLCQRCMDDPEPIVREAAAGALLNFIKRDVRLNESGLSILNSLYLHFDELGLEEQTKLIILLIQHGSLVQQTSAQSTLDLWLGTAAKSSGVADGENRAQTLASGLIVLVESQKLNKESSRLTELVGSLLKHPTAYVRQQLIPALVRQCKYVDWDGKHWAVQSLVKLLEDTEENARLAVIEELQEEVKTIPLKPVVWQALNDPDLTVRKLACKLPVHLKLAETQMLLGCLDSSDVQAAPYRAESAIYLLIQSGQRGMRAALGRAAESLVHDTYWLTLQGLALKDLALADKPGVRLMFNAFQEASRSVSERIFWLISADSSEEEVQAVQSALPSSDPVERANAAEAMEALLPPVVARQLCRLLDGSPSDEIIACAENELGMHPPSLMQVLQNAWTQQNAQDTRPAIPQRVQNFYNDGWLTTTAIYLLTEVQSQLSMPHPALSGALSRTLEADIRPNVQEAAKLVLSRLDSNPKETAMSSLTLIEKVIFLKEVPFFNELPLQEISILAGISEEVSYPAEHKIFSQGDNTKTLYLVIRGQVSVQQSARTGSIVRLKTLGAKDYFAETSIFDGAPHQADIVTIDPVDILLIRQSTLFTLIHRRPDIGLSLLKALSQRLRETYAEVAKSERANAKPQKLMNLYDKIGK